MMEDENRRSSYCWNTVVIGEFKMGLDIGDIQISDSDRLVSVRLYQDFRI